MSINSIPLRRRLSVRQAQLAVAIAVTIGMAFAFVQIFLDARKERQNLANHAESVLDYASLPAARAAYRLDSLGAQELADSLMSDPAIVRVAIRDDFNDQLAIAQKELSTTDARLARFLLGEEPVTFSRNLVLQGTDVFVGELTIEIEPVASAPGFEQRTLNAIISGLIKSTLLSALLLIIFHFMITKRVARLAERVSDEQSSTSASQGDELDTLEQRIEEWSETLEKAAEDAREANNAKSIFLASMSHEMRTPLNAIVGYSEMMEMGIGQSQMIDQKAYLQNITNAGRQLNKLLGDILDFSRIEAGAFEFNLEPVNPADTIRNNAPMIRDMVKSEGLEYVQSIKTSENVIADRARVRQIIFNLVTNAIKYNKPGGTVEVGCEITADNALRIFVADTGIGVPSDGVEKLFEGFVRGNHHGASIPGAGLGLSICKLLTEAMGGRIGYSEREGGGSIFWFEFDIPEKSADTSQD